MIDRYTITALQSDLETRFNAEATDRYQPKYNAGPTQILPVITNTGPAGFSYFYWGLMPEWTKNKSISAKLINAESDQLLIKTSYKKALEQRRCLIAADGFYAWKGLSKKARIPHRITLNDQAIFSIAGIWEEFEDHEGEFKHTFNMVTVPAPEEVSDVTPVMPAILTPENERTWLESEFSSPESLVDLLKPYPGDEISYYTVSPRIMHEKADGPELIRPTQATDQFGNYSLFD